MKLYKLQIKILDMTLTMICLTFVKILPGLRLIFIEL